MEPFNLSAQSFKSARSEEDYDVALNYRILYEDETFLAVEKPAPLPVHPGGRFLTKNLLSLLKKERSGYLSIINRLDSETSGIVLAAKSSQMAGELGKLFEFRKIRKDYEALLIGVPSPASGQISTPLGFRQVERFRMRCEDPEGETAVTNYNVLQVLERGAEKWAHVHIQLETGRMHQIRAHFALTGCPVAGDKIYIEPAVYTRYIEQGWQEDMLAWTRVRRLLLHASRLIFQHPQTGAVMDIQSKVPEEFFAGPV